MAKRPLGDDEERPRNKRRYDPDRERDPGAATEEPRPSRSRRGDEEDWDDDWDDGASTDLDDIEFAEADDWDDDPGTDDDWDDELDADTDDDDR